MLVKLYVEYNQVKIKRRKPSWLQGQGSRF